MAVRYRLVRIVKVRDAYFVKYVQRLFGGRYHAAQFDARYMSRKKVVEWVESKPSLILIDEPKDI